MSRIALDLDGTINFTKTSGSYGSEKLQPSSAETIRKWKEQGHYIIIYTGRHMQSMGSNIGKVVANVGLETIEWLKNNDIPYDELWFGKPHYDVAIDDRTIKHNGDWLETESAVNNYLDTL